MVLEVKDEKDSKSDENDKDGAMLTKFLMEFFARVQVCLFAQANEDVRSQDVDECATYQ